MNAIIRPRGLIGRVYAAPRTPQAGDVAGLLEDVANGLEDFRKRHDARAEQLEEAVDGMNQRLAALQIGGAGDAGGGARNRSASLQTFATFMRTGTPQAAMRSSSDPDGGYSVPENVDGAIQDTLVEFSPLRSVANVVTLGQGAGSYSFLVGRRGASSGWVGESESRPETNTPTLGKVLPPEGEVYGNAGITQWLLDDSGFDIGGWLQDNIVDEFAVQEGAAFVSGNGVNKPRGFLSMPAPVTTGDATRAFGTLQYVPTGVAAALSDATHNGADVLIDVVHTLKPAYKAGPGVAWVMNSTTAALVRKFKTIGDTEHYLWREALEGGNPTLLGFPVLLDENMPDVAANAFPIAFGNWRRGYRIVDRLGTRVLRDPYTNKPNVMFYMTKRVGGHVADSNAIKLLKVATS